MVYLSSGVPRNSTSYAANHVRCILVFLNFWERPCLINEESLLLSTFPSLSHDPEFLLRFTYVLKHSRWPPTLVHCNVSVHRPSSSTGEDDNELAYGHHCQQLPRAIPMSSHYSDLTRITMIASSSSPYVFPSSPYATPVFTAHKRKATPLPLLAITHRCT